MRWVECSATPRGCPIPEIVDPGFLPDAHTVAVALTAGGQADLESFSTTVPVGDDFTLDGSSTALISAIPTNGSAFTLACSSCGSATVTRSGANDTTDGVLPIGAPAHFMRAPLSRAVRIRCVGLGVGSITVPASVSACIQAVPRHGATAPRRQSTLTAHCRSGSGAEEGCAPGCVKSTRGPAW